MRVFKELGPPFSWGFGPNYNHDNYSPHFVRINHIDLVVVFLQKSLFTNNTLFTKVYNLVFTTENINMLFWL